MITEDQRDLLVGVIAGVERLDNITITAEPKRRTVTITFTELDEDYFDEITETLA